MLSLKFIKENKEQVKKACRQKKVDCDIDKLLQLDEKRRELLQKTETLKAEQNKLDKNQIESAKELKQKIKSLTPELKQTEADLDALLYEVPNVIAEEVPEGPDESGNKVLRKFQEPTGFDFQARDHMELGILNRLIDTEKSAEISGARFNYLFNEAVLLQFALVKLVFDTLTNPDVLGNLAEKVGNPSAKVFKPVVPPVIAKEGVMKKMDRFDPIEDRYYLEKDKALFIGSAEHTLGPLHMNEIIDEKDLPIRYIGYSTAFRREAGSYGKDTAGILRRHQFDKAEMETFVKPEDGMVEQDLIVAIQEYLVQQLEIPYQVVLICTGDMGKPDFRQIDIECWMPGQDKYRETHTSDYMTDFQSRRLNIKFRGQDNKTEPVHMNDATAFAIGRIMIAILENYQQKDGSITVPKVLRDYLGKEVINNQ